jgi:ArsR family transcriptional regulator
MPESEKVRFAAKANILKALGHPTRLRLAEQLSAGERCMGKLDINMRPGMHQL